VNKAESVGVGASASASAQTCVDDVMLLLVRRDGRGSMMRLPLVLVSDLRGSSYRGCSNHRTDCAAVALRRSNRIRDYWDGGVDGGGFVICCLVLGWWMMGMRV